MPNHRTILVLDDEPTVLAVSSLVLLAYGFEVLPAASAKEAREQFNRSGNQIALLIADVALPDASGVDVALQCSTNSPTLGVIITSGSPPDVWSDWDRTTFGRLLSSRVTYLEKPFTPARMLRAVNSVLGPPEELSRAAFV